MYAKMCEKHICDIRKTKKTQKPRHFKTPIPNQ